MIKIFFERLEVLRLVEGDGTCKVGQYPLAGRDAWRK